jgi:hypothetical protein
VFLRKRLGHSLNSGSQHYIVPSNRTHFSTTIFNQNEVKIQICVIKHLETIEILAVSPATRNILAVPPIFNPPSPRAGV